MITFAFIDAQGLIERCGKQLTLPDGAIAIDGFSGPMGQLARSMIVEDELVARPLSPNVTSAGTTHTIADIPAGTLIEVYDLTGGELMDAFTVTIGQSTEVISLPDPGSYRIEISAPAPHLPRHVRVEI